MKPAKVLLVLSVLLLGMANRPASGMIGVYGIVDRVVFEPNERAPERIQVWGAFAYVDGDVQRSLTTSAAKRGYLYFKFPAMGMGGVDQARIDVMKKEWADLKAVAGTGQAVGFGSWFYIGAFPGLDPSTRGSTPPYILETSPRGASETDLRVRPATEAPTAPASYQTNVGIVKLSETGSHAEIVRKLKTVPRG